MAVNCSRQEAANLRTLATELDLESLQEPLLRLEDGENSLQNERRLVDITDELRRLWLLKQSATGKGNPLLIEKRLAAKLAAREILPPNWYDQHIFYCSGMAAAQNYLQHYLSRFQPTERNRLKILSWGGYYEILFSIEVVRRESVEWVDAKSEEDFYETLADPSTRLVFLDPIAFAVKMRVLDIERFLDLWNFYAEKVPRTLVLDTTLCGRNFPLSSLLGGLNPSTTVCRITSALKLDQEGLELQNAGILSLYNSDENLLYGSWKELMEFRDWTSTALTGEEWSRLDTPFFLEQRHATDVFQNNGLLAEALAGNQLALLESVSYPQGVETWHQSPFLFVQTHDDGIEAQGLMTEVLVHEIRRRGLSLDLGASFGFRQHRFEVIVPDVSSDPSDGGRLGSTKEPKTLLRVSMGSGQGPSANLITELFCDVFSYPSLDCLRRAYQSRSRLTQATLINFPFRPFQAHQRPSEKAGCRDLTVQQEALLESLPLLPDSETRYWLSTADVDLNGGPYEFEEREFFVDQGVFMPNFLSTLIFRQITLQEQDFENKDVAIVGCGAGVEGILSAEAGAEVYLTDIDPVAVASAQKLSNDHPRMHFYSGNLFEKVPAHLSFDFILCHPPSVELDFGDPIQAQIYFSGSQFITELLEECKVRLNRSGELWLALSDRSDLREISKIVFQGQWQLDILQRERLNDFDLRGERGEYLLFRLGLSQKIER